MIVRSGDESKNFFQTSRLYQRHQQGRHQWSRWWENRVIRLRRHHPKGSQENQTVMKRWCVSDITNSRSKTKSAWKWNRVETLWWDLHGSYSHILIFPYSFKRLTERRINWEGGAKFSNATPAPNVSHAIPVSLLIHFWAKCFLWRCDYPSDMDLLTYFFDRFFLKPWILWIIHLIPVFLLLN